MTGLTINQDFESSILEAEERFCSNCALYEPNECGNIFEIFGEKGCEWHEFYHEYTPPEWDF